jgi:hypothetical protein
MESKDLTLKDFIGNPDNKKIVIVKHAENNFSHFLVIDSEKPQIPGFPACCLTYYNSKKEALEAMEEIYKKVGYKPKYPETGYWSA